MNAVSPTLAPQDVGHLIALSQAMTAMAQPPATASGVGVLVDAQRLQDTRAVLREGETFSVQA